jgi:hypothetical protein
MPSGLPTWKLNWIRPDFSPNRVREKDVLPELRFSLELLISIFNQMDSPWLRQEDGIGGAACEIGSMMGT